MANMRYGCPYMGSKNSIARPIVDFLPRRKNFIDLFEGGCAITHAALLRGAWEEYYINDINRLPLDLFTNAIEGKYANEKRWIDRATFKKECTIDPYIAYCWSFGNSSNKNYLYSVEFEPWKRALHMARVFNDISLFETMGIKTDGSRKDIADHEAEYKAKYIDWFLKNVDRSNERIKRFDCKSLIALQSLESLERLQSLERLGRLHKSSVDYAEFKIPDNSIIYCDIPYEATAQYNDKSFFSHKRFYDWACAQSEPLCISSYNVSDPRFMRIWNVPKRALLNVKEDGSVKQEGLFIPKDKLGWWKKNTITEGECLIYEQTTLF